MSLRIALLFLLAAGACGSGSSGDPDGGGDGCSLSAEARAILSAETTRQALDGAWIVANSHPMSDRGYARNLMGSSNSHMGSLTPIGPCTGPMTFDPYCECLEPPCDEPVRCSQLGCEDAGHQTMDVWWEGTIDYAAEWTDPAGANVAYTGMPTTEHDYVEGTDILTITWQADDVVSVTIGDQNLDLSSALDASGTSDLDGPMSIGIGVNYPGLSATLQIDREAGTATTGTLDVDGTVVADVVETGADELPTLAWRAPCD